jgi:DNA-binding transcriptional LysR family regulator
MARSASQRYKELRLAQLRAYCACVRERSFSAAARALGMSQPAVWQQVRALERDFGVGLLERRGRSWEPTEDGRVLLELAATVLGNVDSLLDTFHQRRHEGPRTLTVIGSPGVLTEELARPVVAFSRKHPEIRLTLLSHAGPRTLDLLLGGNADLAVLPLASEAAGQRQFLVTEPLCERPWVLAMPKGNALHRKRQLKLEDIVRYPLILPEEQSNWRKRVDDLFRANGLLEQVHVVLEASMTLAARRYVSLGLGVALLPQPLEGLELPRVVTRPMAEHLPAEQIVLVWRRGATPKPQARLFAEFVKQRLGALR